MAQLLQAVAPPAVQIHMGSHGGSEVKVDVVDIYIGGWGGESNREIVSFRSCVRAGEARRSCVGEREAMRCVKLGPGGTI